MGSQPPFFVRWWCCSVAGHRPTIFTVCVSPPPPNIPVLLTMFCCPLVMQRTTSLKAIRGRHSSSSVLSAYNRIRHQYVELLGTLAHQFRLSPYCWLWPSTPQGCIKYGSTCVQTTEVACLKDINAEAVLTLQAGFSPYYSGIYTLMISHSLSVYWMRLIHMCPIYV